MSEFDKWSVSSVLPGKCERYGAWIVHHNTQKKITIVYHEHKKPQGGIDLISVNLSKNCRQCNNKVPAGVWLRSKTLKIGEAR